MRTGMVPVRLGERASSVPETENHHTTVGRQIKEGATMTTRKSHNVGVRNHNPNVAPIQAGSEGTVNPSAVIPVVPVAPASAPVSDAVIAAVQTFTTAFESAVNTLVGVLPNETPGNAKHFPKVQPSRLHAIPLLSEMLRKYPVLSVNLHADDTAVARARAGATAALSRLRGRARGAVDNATRVYERNAWHACSQILVMAERKAVDDINIARDFAVVQGILAIGPRKNTAPVTAVKAQQRAARAQSLLTKAQQKAAVKAAAAAQHGTGDVTIVPAGTTTPGSTPTK